MTHEAVAPGVGPPGRALEGGAPGRQLPLGLPDPPGTRAAAQIFLPFFHVCFVALFVFGGEGGKELFSILFIVSSLFFFLGGGGG